MQMIVADKPAEMWDVRYKVPYTRSYKNEKGEDVVYTNYQHFGVKCVAKTAGDACALVLQHRQKAIVLGVHHRSGGEDSRVLIDRSLLTETRITPAEARAVERGLQQLRHQRDSSADDAFRQVTTDDIKLVKDLLERLG